MNKKILNKEETLLVFNKLSYIVLFISILSILIGLYIIEYRIIFFICIITGLMEFFLFIIFQYFSKQKKI